MIKQISSFWRTQLCLSVQLLISDNQSVESMLTFRWCHLSLSTVKIDPIAFNQKGRAPQNYACLSIASQNYDYLRIVLGCFSIPIDPIVLVWNGRGPKNYSYPTIATQNYAYLSIVPQNYYYSRIAPQNCAYLTIVELCLSRDS